MKRDLPSFRIPAEAGTVGPGSTWRVALTALLVSLAWIVGWHAPTAVVMVSTWANSETFAHGFVVLPIALWLAWRERDRLALLSPRPDWRALPLLALAGFVWLAARLGAVNVVSQAAMVAMLVLTVPAVLGAAVARALMFPLGFLFFGVPVGEFLLPTLMERTADFTVAALRWSGVPVYREGLQLVIPTGRWSIVEACSGVRYLIASLMVGTLFAYLNYRSLGRRLAFVALSIVVPIVANWIRAYMIVMLGHLTNNRLAVGVDHIVYGWVFFGFVMLLMFWVGSRWRERYPAERASPAAASEAAPPVAGLRPAGFLLAAVATMALTAVWPLVADRASAVSSTAPAELAIGTVPGWQSAPAAQDGFEPRFVLPSASVHERFARGGSNVGLYVAYYRDQNFGRKLVTSENRIVTSLDSIWNSVGVRRFDVTLGGETHSVAMTQLQARDGRQLFVLQWYWLDGAITSNDAIAKARLAWSRLTGRGDDSAAVVVYAPAATAREAEASLRTFVHDAWPSVVAGLARTRDHR